uniref:Putative GIY YIG homing endonuclease n=1 Tax=Oogamochlamys gigantea TaxID=158507 RepID=A0A0S2LN25_9CHLO|nr:putative GIY YIG homing endonuclease [Oogamochlamys gigantea]ALO62833.1 putative GIY YIG homing endonuclease [Oogamochlamys gigantea]
MSQGLFSAAYISEGLSTIHLKTDPGGIQNNRPGVYVIKHIENGMCIVGQTKDLKKRFNQYTSRSKGASTEINKINKNFYVAVQEAINNEYSYSQVFQRFVVYTWVDENKKPLDMDSSLVLKNEMNYLEHRLILAFFECGLCYNFNDVSPQFIDLRQPEKNTTIANPKQKTKFSEKLAGPRQAKPFKVDNFFFYSSNDYLAFRNSIGESEKKKFLAMPGLRKRLKQNINSYTAEIRYLTKQEILDAKKKDLFYKPET